MSSEDYSNIKPGGKIVDDYSSIKPGGKIAEGFSGGEIQTADKNAAWNKINQQYPNLPDFVKKGLFNLVVNRIQNSGRVLPSMQQNEKVPEFGATVAKDMLGLNKNSAMGAFTRGAISSPLELASNLQEKLPGYPEALKKAELPEGIRPSKLDEALHPWATGAGKIVGGIAPFAAGGEVLDALPVIGRSLELMKKLPLGQYLKLATEGAGLGAAFAPQGQEGQWAGLGAVLGPTGEAVMSGIKAAPAAAKRLSNAFPGSKLASDVGDLEKQAASADTESAIANQAQESAKELAKQSGHVVDADRLTGELKQLHEKLADSKEQLSKSAVEMPSSLTVDPEVLKQNADNDFQSANEAVSKTKQDLSNYIPEGETKDTKLRNLLVNWFEKEVKAPVSQGYENFEKELENYPIKVSLNDLGLENLPKEYENYSDAAKSQILNAMGKPLGSQTTAADAFSQYQTLRNLATDARQRQYMPTRDKDGNILTNEEEKANWGKQADDLEKKAEDVKNRLQSMLPKNLKDTMDELSSKWAREVKPIENNKVYSVLKKTGQYNGDIINDLRGSGESPAESIGRQSLREKIRQHPEMNRLSLGMKYAKNPELALTDNEEAAPYIKNNAIFSRKLQNHQKALQLQNEADTAAKLVKNSITDMKAKGGLQQKIIDLENDIRSKEMTRDRLLEARNRKNIAAREKMKIDLQLKKKTQELNRARKDRKILTITALALAGGPYAMYKISGLL
jgi:hypothetical protein